MKKKIKKEIIVDSLTSIIYEGGVVLFLFGVDWLFNEKMAIYFGIALVLNTMNKR